MGCINSRRPRHIPLVNREDDPWDEGTSIALSGIPLKIVIVGDEAVGKTSFVLRMISHKFDDSSAVKTIGIDFWRHIIEVDGENISLQIWDTAGDPEFAKIAEAYYKTANGFLVAFSTTNKKSFEKVESYIERIRELNTVDNPVILLVGTKCDETLAREVNLEEAEQFASQQKLQYHEVSSKDNINIENVVTTLAKRIKENSSLHTHPD